MKFWTDERVKHRVTGLVVILSIAAIFVPAIMKKSNQHFEENVSFSVRLPHKPVPPKVVVTDQSTMFQALKVAKADIPAVQESPSRETLVVKAEPIRDLAADKPLVNEIPSLKTASIVEKIPAVVMQAKPKVVSIPRALPKTLTKATVAGVKKEMYGVQIAAFAQQNNAVLLVNRLKSKGYKASYQKMSGKTGGLYRVVVGQVTQKNQAIDLQKQLKVSVQLDGIVIKTNVG